MKTCKECKKSKPETSFNLSPSRYKDKVYYSRQAVCGACKARKYRAKYPDRAKLNRRKFVENNPEIAKTQSRRRSSLQAKKKLDMKIKLLELLGQTICVDCGNNNPRVLSFHHRIRDDKAYEVTTALYRRLHELDAILDEARKCDILCLNCHHLRHVLA